MEEEKWKMGPMVEEVGGARDGEGSGRGEGQEGPARASLLTILRSILCVHAPSH